MKITEIRTYLVDANVPNVSGWRSRNWMFAKVFTDEGITGVGEGSGWPRVVETAVKDLA
ncbi:MAG: mandelate racemase/muconate lactonizing enzyme family protein, partial [Caldilineaceae bacterium]